ncbi:suppressor of fused domain protein [Pseudonocardia sp. HH130629-09]|uniref:suppressor of fused domain protein n=1 Tax=Pseudonocardia sp. HH130629-09 TaxID=1641402 RepID=UPI0014389FA0|nr:suppressor of fused domain protein [Pseudonocardia sp. HH130629-09]
MQAAIGGPTATADPSDPGYLDAFIAYESILTDHYEEFLVETSMVFFDDHWQHSDEIKINVHLYPSTEGRPFLTLATCGMGLTRMNVNDTSSIEVRDLSTGAVVAAPDDFVGNEEYSRAELLLYLPADWDFGDPDGYVPLQLLVRLARYPHRESTWLGPEQTVSNGPGFEPFFEGSLLAASYFLPAVLEQEEFFHFDIGDGAHLHVLWVQPITIGECHLKRTEGPAELNVRLMENDVLVLDIDRACTVSPETRAQRRTRERAQKRRRRSRRELPWESLTCGVSTAGWE